MSYSCLNQSRMLKAFFIHPCIRGQLLPVCLAILAIVSPCSYIVRTYINMHKDARIIGNKA